MGPQILHINNSTKQNISHSYHVHTFHLPKPHKKNIRTLQWH